MPNKEIDKIMSSTYALLTAGGMLKELGIDLTTEDKIRLLHENDALYRKLFTPLCEYIMNQHVIDHCDTLDKFSNEEISNIERAYQDYCIRNELRLDAQDPTLTATAAIKEKLNQFSFKKHTAEASHQKGLNELLETLKQHIKEWQALQASHAVELTQALINDGYNLSDNFQDKLQQRLSQQTISLPDEIPSELLKRFKIKHRAPTLTEKALLSVLLEEQIDG